MTLLPLRRRFLVTLDDQVFIYDQYAEGVTVQARDWIMDLVSKHLMDMENVDEDTVVGANPTSRCEIRVQ